MKSTDLTSLSRRQMLTGAASLGVLGALGICARAERQPKGGLELQEGDVILFQGDSITDAGRKMDVAEPNDGDALGKGYAAMAAGEILLEYNNLDLKFYNRGISGNKVPDLAGRWAADAVKLKPSVLSILVGVNDLWHTFAFGNKYKATVQDYESRFRELIKRSQEQIPGVKMVICEPFTTRTSDDFKSLAKYREVARKLADEMQLTFVPFQALFDEALKAAPAKFWLWDGIHPTPAGHAIMVRKWREVVGV